MTRHNAIVLGVTFAAIALLAFLQNLINRKRLYRSRQYLMPAIALVYAVGAREPEVAIDANPRQADPAPHRHGHLEKGQPDGKDQRLLL